MTSGCKQCLHPLECKVHRALEDAVGEQQSRTRDPVPNEPGRKFEFSSLAETDGTPYDRLAKVLPAVLAEGNREHF